MVKLAALLLALIPSIAIGQDNDPVMHVGNGVSQPRVLHKVDPTFSKEAEREKIQAPQSGRTLQPAGNLPLPAIARSGSLMRADSARGKTKVIPDINQKSL